MNSARSSWPFSSSQSANTRRGASSSGLAQMSFRKAVSIDMSGPSQDAILREHLGHLASAGQFVAHLVFALRLVEGAAERLVGQVNRDDDDAVDIGEHPVA